MENTRVPTWKEGGQAAKVREGGGKFPSRNRYAGQQCET